MQDAMLKANHVQFLWSHVTCVFSVTDKNNSESDAEIELKGR